MDKRDTCIFYRSIFESIQELSKEQQADIYNAVFEYCLNFNEIELNGISKTIFNLVKPVLAANNSRYINGSQPKTNKYIKNKAKEKQIESKDNVDKEQKSSESEAYKYKNKYNYKYWSVEEFISSIKENGNDYDSKMLNDFYNHWSEKDANGKMKFQLEKTWETNKRLSTWKKRSDQWSNNKTNKSSVEQTSRSERGIKY
jgi:hypothetical protein